MVNVNDCCLWVRASSSPLAVKSSSVAMEMAPYAHLLLPVKIQALDGGTLGQTQLGEDEDWINILLLLVTGKFWVLSTTTIASR